MPKRERWEAWSHDGKILNLKQKHCKGLKQIKNMSKEHKDRRCLHSEAVLNMGVATPLGMNDPFIKSYTRYTEQQGFPLLFITVAKLQR